MVRRRVVFEGETAHPAFPNAYWIGREGEEPIGVVACTEEVSIKLHALLNEAGPRDF